MGTVGTIQGSWVLAHQPIPNPCIPLPLTHEGYPTPLQYSRLGQVVIDGDDCGSRVVATAVVIMITGVGGGGGHQWGAVEDVVGGCLPGHCCSCLVSL